MKYAVMSDIHCNLITFNMLISDALNNEIKNFLFLGDYVTDGYHGNEILEIIKNLKGTAILGNREKYVKTFQKNGGNLNYKLNSSALCYDSLSSDSLEYINSLKEVEFIDINGKRVLMIHGDDFNYDNRNISLLYDKLIEKYDFDICLFGHSHVRRKDVYMERTFINPGSVGQPLDGLGFSYCIIEITKEKQPSVNYRFVEINQKILNDIKNDFITSNFSKYNPEWCELIMASISNSFDFITLFMNFFNESISNHDMLTPNKYDELLKNKYQEFSIKYNIDTKHIT